jgi:PhnB protein
MAKLNPYLRFNDGKCREAMTFYQSCLGGKLSFQTVAESPMAKEIGAEAQNRIMHSTLKAPGIDLYGSDMIRDKATVGDNFSMSLECESEEEINSLFKKLSAGGEVFQPVEEVPWGAIFGMVTDKYGVEWMLNYQKTPLK